ncbi:MULTISPECIES: NfeD family protein [unclassified Cyanobium]|jgi:membrane protein implicated in regulation of membrane protease activity|uniref:NfeD family protein n=1 Tax=unclassified Cyanobium TaxID=2627006 RepID=UPI0020CDD294|nr:MULTISPECIES: NfeD family protein [unclassified Cyanobium]MCP9797834.1 NfeD family protein [Cyanobium sp. Lug-B]MCP9934866.1 NfeD family protein [Cyanobium sp. Candia 9D4]
MPAPPILWLALAGVLLLLELVGADGDGLLLIGAVAALLLTLVAILAPVLPPLGQLLLYAVLVGAGYAWLRRWSARRQARTIPPSARAELAEVTTAFDANGEGRVRWQGQSWAAQNLAPQQSLPPGSQVTVMGREGTRLQVLPRQENLLG